MKFEVLEPSDPISVRVLRIHELLRTHAPVSFGIVEVDGTDKPTIDTTSDTFDYVLEGSGTFEVAGREVPVRAGQLVCVPRNTEFTHSGKMKLLAVHQPGFNRDGIKVVDDG